MAVEIVPIGADTKDLIREFSRKIFADRPNTEDFLDWRYARCPVQRGVLAVRNGVAIAMLGAFEKTYLYQSQQVVCLETNDWFRLPDVPGFTGLQLLQTLMNSGKTILAFGGTDAARGVLHKMHWVQQNASRFILPLKGAALNQRLSRRLNLPDRLVAWVGHAAASYYRAVALRTRPAPRGWSTLPCTRVGSDVRTLYSQADQLSQLPDEKFLDWLTSEYPDAGAFTTLYFLHNGKLRGWSLSRVVDTGTEKIAALLEVWGERSGTAEYAWMVNESVRAVAGFSPDVVMAATSCPQLTSALAQNHFLHVGPFPVAVYSPNETIPAVRASLLCTDQCLMPYSATRNSSEGESSVGSSNC